MNTNSTTPISPAPLTFPYGRIAPKGTDLDLIVLLDRSGSMSSIKTDMEGGLDTLLKEQAQVPGCRLTLVQFDNVVETVYNRLPLELVPMKPVLDPRGGTALLDAMGQTLTEQAAHIAEGSKVMVVIITDGQENSSREWKREGVKALVNRLTERGWLFTYLGANVDAFAEASTLGISQDFAANYHAGAKGVSGALGAMGVVGMSYRTGNASGFTEDQRKAMAER